MFGFLIVNKPPGWTSRDVVNVIQKHVRPFKVGHAGTLDPLATGVLVLGIGQATRLFEFLQGARKAYEATFLLGRESDTEDTEGSVTILPNPTIPSQHEIEIAAQKLIGRIMQRPPAYSAIKVKGQAAYARARRGELVELNERPVDVYEIRIREYAYPILRVGIVCGSGTYIRSLGRDMAKSLGTATVMSALSRTFVGPFRMEDAFDLTNIDRKEIEDRLRPPIEGLSHIPKVTVNSTQARQLMQGQVVDAGIQAPCRDPVAVVDQENRLVAMAEISRGASGSSLRPLRCFPNDANETN